MKKNIEVHSSIALYLGRDYCTDSPGVVVEAFAEWRCTSRTEAIKHFNLYAHQRFLYEYNSQTEVADLSRTISKKMGFKNCGHDYDEQSKLGFLFDHDLLCAYNKSLNLSNLIARYELCSPLQVLVIFNGCAGEMFREKDPGISYYMRSRERGSHHQPHIHIDYIHKYTASIAIDDGSVLAGDIPKKALKTARDRIKANKEYLLEKWNSQTDGLDFDLHYGMGLADIKR